MMSQPAASAAAPRSGMLPSSACMSISSLSNSPSKPILPRITSAMILSDNVAGLLSSQAVKTICALMPSGWPASSRKGAMSVSSSASLAVTIGSSLWLSIVARPCPGMCLRQPTTPPLAMPSSTARPSAATCIGSLPSARSPITSSVSGRLTSNGAWKSTVTPTSASSRAMASAFTRAASIAEAGAISNRREKTSPAGYFGHSGGFIRATRPPS